MSDQPKSFSVNFTEAEAQALFALLHLAVKSVGLEGPHAANAVVLQQKLNAAHAETKKEIQNDSLGK